MFPVYLDYNASTPLAPEVRDAIRDLLDGGFGNPSSDHAYGNQAHLAVETARGQVARLLGAHPDEIVFTGCASESDNLAVKGVALGHPGGHIVTSAVEHPAILGPCAWLEERGFEITRLPVDCWGRVDPADVAGALRPDTLLVSVMHANNEVGTLQPVAEIARIAHAAGVLVHSDGAQAPGKVPCRIADLGVDLYTVAGHKLYAPKGVGALYIRRGLELDSLVHGAGHEGGRRAGTENVLGIVGLGAAAAMVERDLPAMAAHQQACRDRLHRGILARVPDAVLNGHESERLPNTLSLALPGLDAGRILHAVRGDVAASAGAACHADTLRISSVLRAMGVPVHLARGTLRLSTGLFSTFAEMDRAADAIVAAVLGLRAQT